MRLRVTTYSFPGLTPPAPPDGLITLEIKANKLRPASPWQAGFEKGFAGSSFRADTL